MCREFTRQSRDIGSWASYTSQYTPLRNGQLIQTWRVYRWPHSCFQPAIVRQCMGNDMAMARRVSQRRFERIINSRQSTSAKYQLLLHYFGISLCISYLRAPTKR